MANNNRLTYVSPKDKFEKIHMNVILKFDAEVVGIYCKLVTMSQGKSLSISWLSKKLGINERRMRKTIVLLEEEGYVTREPLYVNGRLNGWDYKLYSEPVRKENRTHAGKPDLSKNSLDNKQTCQKTDKTVNGQDINNYTKSISINNTDSFKETDKNVLSDDNTQKAPTKKQELSEVEQRYMEAMKAKYPRFMRLDKPLTYEQSQKLKAEYTDSEILQALEQLENYKNLLKNYVYGYRTLINWIKKNREYGG